MSEQREDIEARPDPRGTWQDWPAKVVFVALLIATFVAISGGRPVLLLVIAAAAGLAWMIRAGLFTARRR